jgi:hypothetical protein
VIGGTGILGPAAAALGRAGTPVTVVARRAAGPHAAAVDATDAAALARALDGAIAARGPFAAALAYAPFAPAASLRAVAARVPGTLVHVLTSRWGAPGTDPATRDAWAPDGAGITRRLTLGWAPGPRWHTPDEVSAAALAALRGDAPAEAVLGALRPWEGRPR